MEISFPGFQVRLADLVEIYTELVFNKHRQTVKNNYINVLEDSEWSQIVATLSIKGSFTGKADISVGFFFDYQSIRQLQLLLLNGSDNLPLSAD